MRKWLVCCCIAAFFVLFGTAAVAAEKTGFVDIKRIMMESEAGKRSTQEIMQHVEKKKAQIEAKETELQKLKEELDKQRSVLTEAAYREKELDYQKRYRDYTRFVEDANEEVRIREQQLTQALIPDIQKIIEEVGNKEGYAAVFDVGTAGLLFSSDKNDITDKIVETYNRVNRSKK